VANRLAPSNGACPLSLRDLLRAAADLPVVLPVVRAPIAGVARGALVAAREARSAIGLALPAGAPPEAWFDAVTRAAGEVASGLPIFLSAEIALEGAAQAQVERASHAAWRLVEAGVTHLAVDAGAVAAAERAAAVEEVARVAVERGICVDLVVAPADGLPPPAEVAAALDALAARGAAPDLVSVRCPAPASAEEARGQVRHLVAICAALGGVPVMRRGETVREIYDALAGSPVKACDDGGVAAGAATAMIPWELLGPAPEERRESAVELAARELSPEGADRLEARAYVEVAEQVERLGAGGSGLALARALEAELPA
jgi:hypothetical protein